MSFDQFLAILRELDARGVEYVLIGGVALNLHGIVRATEDVDLFVRVEEKNIERLKDALRALWTDSNDPRLTPRIRRLWEFSMRLSLRRAPSGVQRFRSIAMTNRERDARSPARLRGT